MYMLILMDFIILVNYIHVDSVRFYKTCELYADSTGFWILVSYVLILLGFWMLLNYVYVDSNGFYNAYKLCIYWFQWIL